MTVVTFRYFGWSCPTCRHVTNLAVDAAITGGRVDVRCVKCGNDATTAVDDLDREHALFAVCGARYAGRPFGIRCLLESGHDGFHVSKWGSHFDAERSHPSIYVQQVVTAHLQEQRLG